MKVNLKLAGLIGIVPALFAQTTIPPAALNITPTTGIQILMVKDGRITTLKIDLTAFQIVDVPGSGLTLTAAQSIVLNPVVNVFIDPTGSTGILLSQKPYSRADILISVGGVVWTEGQDYTYDGERTITPKLPWAEVTPGRPNVVRVSYLVK